MKKIAIFLSFFSVSVHAEVCVPLQGVDPNEQAQFQQALHNLKKDNIEKCSAEKQTETIKILQQYIANKQCAQTPYLLGAEILYEILINNKTYKDLDIKYFIEAGTYGNPALTYPLFQAVFGNLVQALHKALQPVALQQKNKDKLTDFFSHATWLDDGDLTTKIRMAKRQKTSSMSGALSDNVANYFYFIDIVDGLDAIQIPPVLLAYIEPIATVLKSQNNQMPQLIAILRNDPFEAIIPALADFYASNNEFIDENSSDIIEQFNEIIPSRAGLEASKNTLSDKELESFIQAAATALHINLDSVFTNIMRIRIIKENAIYATIKNAINRLSPDATTLPDTIYRPEFATGDIMFDKYHTSISTALKNNPNKRDLIAKFADIFGFSPAQNEQIEFNIEGLLNKDREAEEQRRAEAEKEAQRQQKQYAADVERISEEMKEVVAGAGLHHTYNVMFDPLKYQKKISQSIINVCLAKAAGLPQSQKDILGQKLYTTVLHQLDTYEGLNKKDERLADIKTAFEKNFPDVAF